MSRFDGTGGRASALTCARASARKRARPCALALARVRAHARCVMSWGKCAHVFAQSHVCQGGTVFRQGGACVPMGAGGAAWQTGRPYTDGTNTDPRIHRACSLLASLADIVQVTVCVRARASVGVEGRRGVAASSDRGTRGPRPAGAPRKTAPHCAGPRRPARSAWSAAGPSRARGAGPSGRRWGRFHIFCTILNRSVR